MKYLKIFIPIALGFLLGVGSVGLYRTHYLQKWLSDKVADPIAAGACIIQYSDADHPSNKVFSAFIICVDGSLIGIPRVY